MFAILADFVASEALRKTSKSKVGSQIKFVIWIFWYNFFSATIGLFWSFTKGFRADKMAIFCRFRKMKKRDFRAKISPSGRVMSKKVILGKISNQKSPEAFRKSLFKSKTPQIKVVI